MPSPKSKSKAVLSVFPQEWLEEWKWRDHRISIVRTPYTNKLQTAVLIHGFGACKEHWRHNVAALSEHFHVLAIDLLGFGSSDKPKSRLASEPRDENNTLYCIDLWAEQIVSLIDDYKLKNVHLVGNSIGGVVAMRAAEILETKKIPSKGIVLIDCAQRAIDDKLVSEQPPLRALARPLLKQLVRQRWITETLFRNLARPSVIRSILKLAYPTKAGVDDQLVSILHSATQDPGARESFRGFINLFNDHLAPELLERLNTPVCVIWGEADPWEPVDQAQRWATFNSVHQIKTLPGLGHCPHDEAPEQINPILINMLETDTKNRDEENE